MIRALRWPRGRRREEGTAGGPRLALLRLLARLFDYALFGLLLMLASLQAGRWAFSGFWLPAKLALLAAPWLALWTALAGATPGKLLLRLRVRSVEPGRVGLAAAMRRELRCLVSGVALGTPVAVLTLLKAGLACSVHIRPVWDRRAGTRVVRLPAAAGTPLVLRWLGAMVRLCVLVAIFRLFTVGLYGGPDALRATLDSATARAAALRAQLAARLPR